MNSKKQKQNPPEYCPFVREYYLAYTLVLGKNMYFPEECDNCHSSFAEIFVFEPRKVMGPNDNLYLCESCKNSGILIYKDGTTERLADKSVTGIQAEKKVGC